MLNFCPEIQNGGHNSKWPPKYSKCTILVSSLPFLALILGYYNTYVKAISYGTLLTRTKFKMAAKIQNGRQNTQNTSNNMKHVFDAISETGS